MRRVILAFALGLSAQPALAAEAAPVPVPATRQLDGVTAAEADAVLAKLTAAQRRVQAGEFQPFELLSGSIASYEMTKRSPREAFLGTPFDKVWQVRRDPAGDRYRQLYRLAYAPDGLGKLAWDIEVAVGGSGDIERVTMIFKPPPPF